MSVREPAFWLVERDEEVALLRRLAEGTALGRAAVVEIAGPPGVGRTSLLEAAVAQAKEAGLAVLHARASQAETGLSRGVVDQFVTGPASAGPHRPPAAFCQAILATARKTPLMLALDDAHWIDEYSRQWLLALSRRAGEAPLLIVFSTGLSGLTQETALARVRDQAAESGVEWHVLRPSLLSSDSVRGLLERASGVAPEDTFMDVLMTNTCGMPALLRSLLDAFRRGECVPTMADEPSMQACLRTDTSAWADEMLSELSADELALLRAITVCDGDFEWELVVALARLVTASSARTLERLRAQRVALDGDPPRLVCPHTHGRVLAQLTLAEREALYADAVELGHRAAIGTPGLARLLCTTPPVGQDWAVRVLTEEAARAEAADEFELAGRLLLRALREPMDEATWARLAIELASVEVRYAPEASDRRLVQVIGRPVGDQRIMAADLLTARGSTDSLRDAVAETPVPRDSVAGDRGTLEAMYWLAVEGPHDATAPAPSIPDPPVDPAQSAALAWQLLVRGQDRARTQALATAALATGSRAPLTVRIVASRVLLLVDDAVEAEAELTAVLVEARRERARSVSAWAHLMRADLGTRTGRLDNAADDVERAMAIMPLRSWHPMTQPTVLALRMSLLLEAGRLDLAAELARADLLPGVEAGLGWARFLFTKGVFHLLAGEPGVAVAQLREVGRRLLARQWCNPALACWRSFAALALRACGDTAEAERLVTEELVLAERWGVPSTLGGVHLMASKVLDGPRRLDSLTTAVELLREAPSRLHYATALLDLAEIRRDGGRPDEAVQLIGTAGELALAGGARELVSRARKLGWHAVT